MTKVWRHVWITCWLIICAHVVRQMLQWPKGAQRRVHNPAQFVCHGTNRAPRQVRCRCSSSFPHPPHLVRCKAKKGGSCGRSRICRPVYGCTSGCRVLPSNALRSLEAVNRRIRIPLLNVLQRKQLARIAAPMAHAIQCGPVRGCALQIFRDPRAWHTLFRCKLDKTSWAVDVLSLHQGGQVSYSLKVIGLSTTRQAADRLTSQGTPTCAKTQREAHRKERVQ